MYLEDEVTLVISSLFDDPPIVVERPLTPEERFLAFHEANKHVYVALRKLALDLVDRGHERIGIGMLFEVLRWQHAMRTTRSEYKLDNSLRSRYARLLMENEPKLAGVFETRVLHGTNNH